MSIRSLLLTGWLVINLQPLPGQSDPVTIDGVIGDEWNASPAYTLNRLVKNTMGNNGPEPDDLSGYFKSLWNKENLLLLVVVADDMIYHQVTDRDHHNDNVEVYLDPNNSKLALYDGVDDDQIRFIPGVDTINSKRGVVAADIDFSYAVTDTGYLFEISLPWTVIADEEFVPAAGIPVGIDMMITDNDEGETKDYILAWHSEDNTAYSDASRFGTQELKADGSLEDVSSTYEPADHDDLAIDETNVRCTLYVDKHHMNASDANTGDDPGAPLLTVSHAIDAACDSASTGVATKVLIQPGIYREHQLTFSRRGDPGLFMNTEIVVEGADPGSVVITGSELMNDGWSNYSANTYRHAWIYDFQTHRAWGDHGPTKPEGWHRELVFVDGHFMHQVLSMEEMGPNTFYVDGENDILYVRVADTIDFMAADKEVGMHGEDEGLSWPPGRLLTIPSGKDKVVLRNLVFRHATMRLSEAALRFHGWKTRMENCRVEYSNGHGLTISSDARYVELIDTHLDHNGGCGLFTWGTTDLTLEGTSSSHNNWRGHMGGLHSYSVAGIKFHHTRRVEVTDHDAMWNWAHGLWTDLEVIDATFDNCTVKDNYGAGFLVEISRDIMISNSVIERNIPGVRCHSSNRVTLDNCSITANYSQFNVYRDHRDFSDPSVSSQFDGRIWDKRPRYWTIRSCTITAVDDPEWQAWAEQRVPGWMHYSNPGYQPFWHFSHAGYMDDFFREATIAYQDNQWIHPVTNTPFRDEESNPLTTEEWEEWIVGIKNTYHLVQKLDTMAMEDDASELTLDMLEEGGLDQLEASNLALYQSLLEGRERIESLGEMAAIIIQANAFAMIREMAHTGDASRLTTALLDDCGVTYDAGLMEDYRVMIAAQEDIPDIETLQELLNAVTVPGIIAIPDLLVFPNPSSGRVCITGAGDITGISLLDSRGRLIDRFDWEGDAGVLDLKGYSGIYILRFTGDERAAYRKIMIQ